MTVEENLEMGAFIRRVFRDYNGESMTCFPILKEKALFSSR